MPGMREPEASCEFTGLGASIVLGLNKIEIRSSLMSATPSVYDFVEENGRTYHRYKQGSMLITYILLASSYPMVGLLIG
jgi:hypothetical protein